MCCCEMNSSHDIYKNYKTEYNAPKSSQPFWKIQKILLSVGLTH